MMRRLAALVAVAVLAVGIAQVVTAAPASAVVPCGTMQVCTYQHTQLGGSMYYYTGPFSACIEVGPPWDGMISSINNNKNIPMKYYRNHGCAPGSCDWTIDELPWSTHIHYAVSGCINDHVWSMWIGWSPP